MLVFFLACYRNLSNHMDRQARGGNKVLNKQRESMGLLEYQAMPSYVA
jgi:hypothetical protein